jgi:hypothetical protein
MKDAEELLTQWGIWSWQGAGVPRCTSPMFALMRDNVAQHSEPANISDDDALRVDRIISTMRKFRPQMAEIITLYYRSDLTMSQVATQKEMNRLKVREIIQAGHAYVEAGLDMEVAA